MNPAKDLLSKHTGDYVYKCYSMELMELLISRKAAVFLKKLFLLRILQNWNVAEGIIILTKKYPGSYRKLQSFACGYVKSSFCSIKIWY